MIHKFKLCYFAFFLLIGSLVGQESKINESELKILYTGNMGFLFQSSGNAVVFDALHDKYGEAYAYPKSEMVDKLIKGTYKNFSAINVQLISHMHGDHFSAKYSLNLLKTNTKVHVMGSQQIISSIWNEGSNFKRDLKQRMKTISYDYKINEFKKDKVHIKAVKCKHAGNRHKKIQNTAYLVNLNGYNILHVGDTSWENLKKPLEILEVAKIKLDIIVLPYWMLYDDKSNDYLEKIVKPNKVLASHIPPSFTEKKFINLLKQNRKIIVIKEIGDVYKY